MKRCLMVLIGLSVVVMIFLSVGPADAVEEVLVKGRLISERCVTEGRFASCYLEDSNSGPWVVNTGERLYRVVRHRVQQWKLDEGFGKKVVIKGIMRGGEILVNDLVPLEGKKKISKACL